VYTILHDTASWLRVVVASHHRPELMAVILLLSVATSTLLNKTRTARLIVFDLRDRKPVRYSYSWSNRVFLFVYLPRPLQTGSKTPPILLKATASWEAVVEVVAAMSSHPMSGEGAMDSPQILKV